jgi:hypothetical protein
MYSLSDQQIDHILHDIAARGIRRGDLQLNLLDHICIIIEQNLGENGDFEDFYASAITAFYKNELSEIEDETEFLLTHKNNFSMKKAMIISGTFSAAAFMSGCFSKILHTPLTDFLLFLGFSSFVFLFLPLMFIVMAREAATRQDKLILTSGSIAGLLYFFCMLLKFLGPSWPSFLGQRWPDIEHIWLAIWLSSLAIALFVFIPAYFFKGIRRPETRMNTIATSILLIAFTGMQFTFTNLRPKAPVKQQSSLQQSHTPEKRLS